MYEIINLVTMDLSEDIAVFLKNNPKVRKTFVGGCIIAIIVAIIFVTLNTLFWQSNRTVLLIFGILSLFAGLGLVISLRSFVIKDRNPLNSMLEDIESERKKLHDTENEQININNIIRRNLNQLNEYYVINKLHSKGSYALSVSAVTIGFLLIIGSVIFMFWTKSIELAAVLVTISGIISEFIGATAFVLYKESNKSVDRFFLELTKLQKMMLAIELATSLETDEKSKQLGKIISSLIEFSESSRVDD